METYLNISDHLLTEEEKKDLRHMIIFIGSALDLIPQEFRKTKHQYSQKD